MDPAEHPIIARLSGLIWVLLILTAGLILVLAILLPQYYLAGSAGQAQTGVKPVSQRPLLPGSYRRPAVAAPDTATIPRTAAGRQVRYGRELIAHTARYLGPQGSVARLTNGMNCQNCHLEAGTKGFANNYLAVAATYPKLRARSGTMVTTERRVNDCLERSLNGRTLSDSSREMRAIVAYINWLGQGIPIGKKVYGTGLTKLAYLGRAADPVVGQTIFAAKCQSCHGSDGQGQQLASGEYEFPPLWGANSYNDGAGLYRVTSLARYVKATMPLGATFDRPQLTDAQAWDVAAFISSQPRPHLPAPRDWPDIREKPLDHPFGPYIDSFSERQHKYGPYQPIADAQLIIAR